MSLYVVVAAGETVRVPSAATGLPFSSTCEALAMPHCRVLLLPCVIEVGEALKGLVIEGHAATLMLVDWFAVRPAQSLLVTMIV